jgi:hypothetical protein
MVQTNLSSVEINTLKVNVTLPDVEKCVVV